MHKMTRIHRAGALTLITALLLLTLAGLSGTGAAAKTYQTGDVIEFGAYPQTKITDAATISALNASSDAWLQVPVLIGSDRVGTVKTVYDAMQMRDVTVNGVRYRGVKILRYLPYTTYGAPPDANGSSSQRSNGYRIGETYWFRWEPIKWRVLDPKAGLVLSDVILDAQAFTGTVYNVNNNYYSDATGKNRANDYANSSIRTWLEDAFAHAAFSSNDGGSGNLNALRNVTLDVSPVDPRLPAATVEAKVFLLSYQDVQNTAYGFASGDAKSETRAASGTDYAKAMGLGVDSARGQFGAAGAGHSYWWLRSAGDGTIPGLNGVYYYNGCMVTAGGTVDAAYVSNVDFCGYGVRPAITFKNGIVDQRKPAEVAPMRGDGDGDGKVLAKDARLALRVSARLETLSAQAVKNLDLDGDGKVSAAEARWILRYSAKLEKTLDFIRKPSKLTVGSYALSFGRYESSDGMTTLQIGSDGSVTQTFIDGMRTSGKWSVVTDSIGQKFMQIDWGDGTENYNVYANDKFSDAWRGTVTYSYVGA